MRTYSLAERIAWYDRLEKRVASAAVACYSPSGKVLVVKASYKDYWGLPGGVIDAGETPRQAAVRELQEEAGLSIDVNALRFVMAVDRSGDLRTYQFVFEYCVGDDMLTTIGIDHKEIVEYDLVTRQDILRGDRIYSETARAWADGVTGYCEQVFAVAA